MVAFSSQSGVFTESSLPALSLSSRAESIYDTVRDLPIVSPHGHCDPSWFSDNHAFDNPAELLIIPDHYVFRMLYSQGVALQDLGIGVPADKRDPRAIFNLFSEHWHKFRGTPSSLWLSSTLDQVFGVSEVLTPANANEIYSHIERELKTPRLRPQALLEAFNIEVLATTDGALDDLSHHSKVSKQELATRLIPTLRPDSILNPQHIDFINDVQVLGKISDEDTNDYTGYLAAIEKRRAYFKSHGATATDHDVPDLMTYSLERPQAQALLSKALANTITQDEAQQFYGHMLTEMAQMSVEDGLVMQIHAGSRRSTNRSLFNQFGPNMGDDIPHRTDWVHGMDALLNRVGNVANLQLILFTLDEATYSRELAPMAGHWPSVRLGPPWWFHDSANGISRYLDQVVESAGYWNLAGFNDDTRAFLSVPARHDLWRRGVSIHLAQQVDRGLFAQYDAQEIAGLLSHDLAVMAYKL